MKIQFLFLALAGLTACEPSPPTLHSDAGIDATISDGSSDAAPSPREFGPAVRIAALSSSADDVFPTPSGGGLVLAFARTEFRNGQYIHVPHTATRATLGGPFSAPSPGPLFGDVSVFDLEMRDDGQEVFFWRGLGSLAFAKRSAATGGFGPVVSLGVSATSPSLARGGLALYAIDLAGEIVVMQRAGLSAAWEQPSPITAAMPFRYAAIDVADDELAMIVSADAASPFAGIYVSRRSSVTDPFGLPQSIRSLKGPFSSARLSPNEDELFFVAELGGSKDIFHSRAE